MFAVMSRFDRAWEEAARDLGATPLADHLPGGRPDPRARHHGGGAVRLHAVVRRVRPHAADRRLAQHAAARDLEHDAQRDLAVALCARHGHRRSSRSSIIGACLGAIAFIEKRRGAPRRNALKEAVMAIGQGDIELAGVYKSYDGATRAVDGVNSRSRTAPTAAFSALRAAARRRSCA